MSSVTQWTFRLGLSAGVIAFVSVLVMIPFELGLALPGVLRSLAEKGFAIFGLAFIWCGIILLVEAITCLYRSWSRFSQAAKIVSVLGLAASTFLGAYLFHWLYRDFIDSQHNA